MLVDDLQPQLKFSRIKGTSDSAKIPRSLVKADAAVIDIALELGMVPGIEGLRPELNAAASLRAQDKILQKGKVPVVAARATQRIKSQISICSRGRRRKYRWIKPFGRRLGIRNRSVYVWPVALLGGGAGVGDDARHRAAAHPQIDWRSRFHRNDSRQRPSSHR